MEVFLLFFILIVIGCVVLLPYKIKNRRKVMEYQKKYLHNLETQQKKVTKNKKINHKRNRNKSNEKVIIIHNYVNTSDNQEYRMTD